MKRITLTLLLATALSQACAQQTPASKTFRLPEVPLIGGPCDRCEGIFDLAKSPGWTDTLPGYYEAGEKMVISGVIYQSDGRTPAPGVILYVYHTNAGGIYPKRPGNGDDGPHGYIRGWMRTDERGRYRFVTIRPGSYPDSNNPQHVHPLICEPGRGYYWIEEYHFAGDPLLKPGMTSEKPRGGPGVVTLTKNRQGVWEGARDIVLGRNVPGYPAAAAGGMGYAPPRYLLAPPEEPGERLELAFRVRDAATGRPVAGAEAFIYQTTHEGRYELLDPKDERSARLHTTARADSSGRFLLSTVLPGEYPGGPGGSRHIHLHHLRAPGYREIHRVINFENNVNDEIREWGKRTGFGVVADIRKDAAVWKGDIVLELEKIPARQNQEP